MGASESMFDGVSGLDNHQQWMNVIGNNIANVNTAGFKDQQFNFSDIISQTLRGATQSTPGGPGGTNFQQVGLGVGSGSIGTNQQEGSLQTTNLATDFAIQGDGFFIVSDGAASHYTRDANFIVDGFGNLNQSSNGFHLQGYGLKQIGNSVAIDTTKVVNLTVPQTINPAQETTLLDLFGNLQSSATTPQTQSVSVTDSLGQLHNVVLTFTPPSSAGGNWFVSASAADLQSGASITVSGGNGATFSGAGTPAAGSAAIHFNALGQLDGSVQPLYLSFSNGSSGGAPIQPQPAQPWIIPGSLTNTNAVQNTIQLNINDPAVGALTSFSAPTATQTQAVGNAQPLLSTQNTTNLTITGNLNATDQVQTLTFPFVPTGGSMTLGLSGQTSSIFSVSNPPVTGDFTTALNSLLGSGNYSIAGGSTSFTITMKGALAGQNVPQLTATNVSLTAATPTATRASATAGVNGAAQVQTVTIAGGPTGGTFTISSGADTATFAFNASAATVQSGLNGLASVIAEGGVGVSLAGGVYTVTFNDKRTVTALTSSGAGLTGGAPTDTVATTTAGANGTNQVDTVTVSGSTGGTFTLSYNGQTTSALAYNATAAQVASALNALSSAQPIVTGAPADFAVTGNAGGPYTITYQNDLGNSAPAFTVSVNGASLTDTISSPTTSITTVSSGPTQFNFSALDSAGVTHSYGVDMVPSASAANVVTWTPTLVSVDNQGFVTGNLASNPTNGATTTFSFTQPDSNGTRHTYQVTMTYGTSTGWVPSLSQVDGAAPPAFITLSNAGNVFDPQFQNIQIKNTGGSSGTFVSAAAQNMNISFAQVTNASGTSSVSGSATPFDGAGGSPGLTGFTTFPPTSPAAAVQKLHVPANELNNGNTAQDLSIDFSKLTNSSSMPSGVQPPATGNSGNSAGTLKSFNVDQTGILHGVYSNGFTQTIGQIVLATFENPSGLSKIGNNDFDISANSGVVNIGNPGSGKFGTIAEGNIETSNVDLATEFSNMILAERGFQANSRIITTSDQMLQDVVNLKQ